MTSRSAVLMIGYLGPGGAERQIGYLARELRERGWEVCVLAFSLDGEGAHFADDLRAAEIPLFALDRVHPEFRSLRLLPRLGRAARHFAAMPDEIKAETLKAASLLLDRRPDLLVCYLDRVNIVGGLAALLAGVPRVLLSGRNLNPSHFPYLDRPWFRDMYRLLLEAPHVTLMANSHAGARSYEHWLGLGHGLIPVVHNGLRPAALPEPDPAAVAALRSELGAGADCPLLLGVFRLSPEKRPQAFFDLVERLRTRIPGLRAAVAGAGVDFHQTAARLRETGQDRHIRLLGRRSDMPALYRAADLMVHVSEAEGAPNAVMEAQWMGCPIVGTLGGGAGEILTEAQRPWFHAVDDLDAVESSSLALLQDPARRLELGQASRGEARARFSAAAMADNTISLADSRPASKPKALRSSAPPRLGAAMEALRLWLSLHQPRKRLRRLLRSLRPAYSTAVSGIWQDGGHCFQAPVAKWLTSDQSGRSRLGLFEDGRPLGPAHASHDDIRALGQGRYSHWGAWIYFSTPDGSDPRTNGRTYTVAESNEGEHD